MLRPKAKRLFALALALAEPSRVGMGRDEARPTALAAAPQIAPLTHAPADSAPPHLVPLPSLCWPRIAQRFHLV